jgi:hypothetical protein
MHMGYPRAVPSSYMHTTHASLVPRVHCIHAYILVLNTVPYVEKPRPGPAKRGSLVGGFSFRRRVVVVCGETALSTKKKKKNIRERPVSTALRLVTSFRVQMSRFRFYIYFLISYYFPLRLFFFFFFFFFTTEQGLIYDGL